ncbi:unnamed protein product [Closterium sp. Naga37s-1]|nr:unnamed protein product [Closterium sp. Naga37s-1]
MLYAVILPASDPLPPLPSAHARDSSLASSARNSRGAAGVGGAAPGRRGAHARAKSWDVRAGAEGEGEGGRAADAGGGAAAPRLVPAMMTSLSLTVECLMTTASVSIQGTWEVGEYRGVRGQGGGGAGGEDGGGNGGGDGGGKGEEQQRQQCCDCLFVLPTSHRASVTAVEVTLADGRFLATAVLPVDEAEAACKASHERAAAAHSAAQPVPPRPARSSFLRLSSASFSRSGSSRHRWKSQEGVGEGDGRAEARTEGEWGEISGKEGGVSGGVERREGGGDGREGGESERRRGADDDGDEEEEVEGSGGQQCVARRQAGVLLDEGPVHTPHMLRLRIPKVHFRVHACIPLSPVISCLSDHFLHTCRPFSTSVTLSRSSFPMPPSHAVLPCAPPPPPLPACASSPLPLSHASCDVLPYPSSVSPSYPPAGDIHVGDGGAAGVQRDERAADSALGVPPLRLSLPSFPTQVPQGTSVRVRATYIEAMTGRQGYSEMSVPLTVPLECVPDDMAVQDVVRVSCTINSGLQCPMKIGDFNHPMKVVFVDLGRATFVGHPIDEDPEAWPNADFTISFQVVTEDVSAAVLVQAPLIGDPDPRASFALSIAPPDPAQFSVFSRAVVFILDSECGLRARPMEDARRAVAAALRRLKPHDSFAVVAFDFELLLLDDELEAASPLPIATLPSLPHPRAVVFILDSETGLRARPMEDARRAVAAALRRLKPHDSFAVVAFDFELLLLDDELEAASPEAVRRACKFVLQAHDWPQPTNVLTPLQLVGGWKAVRVGCITTHSNIQNDEGPPRCLAFRMLRGHTAVLQQVVLIAFRMLRGHTAALQQVVLITAFRMLRGHTAALQQIVLITDGPVRAERRVCHWVQRALADWGGTAPRISTFGIGPSVNPFFLKWLAAATRSSSQVTRNPAEVRRRLDGMLQTIARPLVTNIAIRDLPPAFKAMARPLVTNIAIRDLPPACELYPYPIPDLYASGPVVLYPYPIPDLYASGPVVLYPYPIPDLYASGPVVVSGRMGDEGPAAGGAEGGGGLPLHVELRGVLASGAPWKFRAALSDAGNLPLSSVRPRPLLALLLPLPLPSSIDVPSSSSCRVFTPATFICLHPLPTSPRPPPPPTVLTLLTPLHPSAPLYGGHMASGGGGRAGGHPHCRCMAAWRPTAAAGGTQVGTCEQVAILTADAWLHGDPQLQQAVRVLLVLCGAVRCWVLIGIRAHAHAAARHLPVSAGPAAHRSAAGAVQKGAKGCCWVGVAAEAGAGGWGLTCVGRGGDDVWAGMTCAGNAARSMLGTPIFSSCAVAHHGHVKPLHHYVRSPTAPVTMVPGLTSGFGSTQARPASTKPNGEVRGQQRQHRRMGSCVSSGEWEYDEGEEDGHNRLLVSPSLSQSILGSVLACYRPKFY